ncbi:hypothetical protein ABVT39_001623 [Epinephelus coioides]
MAVVPLNAAFISLFRNATTEFHWTNRHLECCSCGKISDGRDRWPPPLLLLQVLPGYAGTWRGYDILARDEAPVQLQDLRSGDPVLAKWSDGKFYRATVEYISGEDQAKPPKGHPIPQESFLNMLKGDEPSDSTSGSDTLIIDRSPLSDHGEKIPALNTSPDGGHARGRNTAGPPPYGSTKGGTIGPSSYGGNTASPSPYGLNTSGLSPYGGHTPSPSPYGLSTSGPSPYGGHTPSPSPYGLSTSGPSPYGGHTPSPSPYGLSTSGPFPYGGHTRSPPPYGLDTPGSSLYGGHTHSPSLYDLSTSGPSPDVGHAAGPSPYGLNTSGPSPGGGHAAGPPASEVNPPGSGKAARLAPDRCSSSSDEGNIPYGQQPENAWTPCDGYPGQVRDLQTLCDLIRERHHDSPSSPSGQQELFPGSGVFISSFRLAAMNQASKPKCMRLFHALFDHFFTVEECQNAVPFGRPGNNPSGKEGKRVLDRKKVDGILTYVLRCVTLPGWEQIEEAKLKKAFVNKCRARAGSKE